MLTFPYSIALYQGDEKMQCSNCGMKTHTAKNCLSTPAGQEARRAMLCTYCHSKKHNTKACPKTAEGNMARKWHPKTVQDDYVED
jgi:primosomal protein N'